MRTDERRSPRQHQVVCGRHVMFGKRRPVGGHAGKDADGFGWAKKGCRFPQCAFLHDPAKKYLRGSAAASDRSRAPAGGSQAGTQARGQARHRVVRQLALPLYLATRGGRDSAPSGSTLGRDRAAATRREAPLVHPGVAPVSRSGVVESLKRCLEVWGDLSVTEGGRECLKRTLGCIADAYFELFSVQWL